MIDEKLAIAISEILTHDIKDVTFTINDEEVTVPESRVQPIRELNWSLTRFSETTNVKHKKYITKVENWFKTYGKFINVGGLPHTVKAKLDKFDILVYGEVKMR